MITVPRKLWLKLRPAIHHFNIFPSIPPTQDEHQLRNQRISTRSFIFLLILSLTILLLYTSLIAITQTVAVNSPTMTTYLQLYATYPRTLSCDCKQISITNAKFLQVEFIFHEICKSVFITRDWINCLGAVSTTLNLNRDDFRTSSKYTFQIMSTFCDLSNETIVNSLTEFYSSRLISSSVVPEELFHIHIRSLISQFISSTTSAFLLSLSSIRQMTQGNRLFSGAQTNYKLYGRTEYVTIGAYLYSGCSCSNSAKCTKTYPVYDGTGSTVLSIVPGMYFGCYYAEALLQSDLRCFYNQTCISEVQSYFTAAPPMNVTALDPSLLVQFMMNSTMEDVVDKLMVEKWIPSITYADYYNACEPLKCSYTHETKNSVIYIITTVIGLIGGLITVLKLIVPRAVAFVTMKHQRANSEAGMFG